CVELIFNASLVTARARGLNQIASHIVLPVLNYGLCSVYCVGISRYFREISAKGSGLHRIVDRRSSWSGGQGGIVIGVLGVRHASPIAFVNIRSLLQEKNVIVCVCRIGFIIESFPLNQRTPSSRWRRIVIVVYLQRSV